MSAIDAVTATATAGVTVVDGTMVDKPVVDRARRILARSGTDIREENP